MSQGTSLASKTYRVPSTMTKRLHFAYEDATACAYCTVWVLHVGEGSDCKRLLEEYCDGGCRSSYISYFLTTIITKQTTQYLWRILDNIRLCACFLSFLCLCQHSVLCSGARHSCQCLTRLRLALSKGKLLDYLYTQRQRVFPEP